VLWRQQVQLHVIVLASTQKGGGRMRLLVLLVVFQLPV